MGIIEVLLIGIAIGVFVHVSNERSSRMNVFGAAILGVVGSFIGYVVINLLLQTGMSSMTVSPYVIAFVGSIVLVLLGRLIEV